MRFGIPGFYEGQRATPERPTNVYRCDPDLCSGGLHHERLFTCGSASLCSLYVDVRDAALVC